LVNLEAAGVIYGGLVSLGQGAILAGMVLGAIGALIIDRRFEMAAGYCFFGAGLAFIGLIHGPKVGWAISPKVALGYAMAGALLLAFAQLKVPRREPDLSDPIEAADAAALAAVPTPRNGAAPEHLGVPGAEPVPA
jgi:AGZA family xanthine/uracil permease-like MFS transporter